MNNPPPDSPTAVLDESEETYCYNHPKTPTRLRCTRCDRPICGRCAIPASVGQHCPECVAEARKSAPKVRTVNVSGSPAVFAFLAINVAVFVVQMATRTPDGNLGLLNSYAGLPVQIANGEWYRLVTPMFLHLSITHIALNSLALYFVGPAVEQAFGTPRFVAMYLTCGFTGSVASYVLGSCAGGAGASGAIFGILGVLLVYTYRRRSNAVMNAYFGNMLVWIGINVVFGLTVRGIDIWAHGGGLVGGMALAAAYDAGPRFRSVAAQVAATAALIGVAVVLVALRTDQILQGACNPFA